MADFYIKVDCLYPSIGAFLRHKDGTPVPLTGTTVTFRMRSPGSDVVKFEAAATIVDLATSEVRYDWQDGDTDTRGLYDAEWPVDRGNGLEIVPASGFMKVEVGPHL